MGSKFLAEEATRLLLAVAAGDPDAAKEYDELLFEHLVAHVVQRGGLLAANAARLVPTGQISLPFADAHDLEELAHDVAVHALERSRRTASRFDPTRGSGAAWAFQAAALSYVDVVRQRTGSRRRYQELPVETEDLIAACDAVNFEPGPAMRYEQQEALDRALRNLEPLERKVLLLQKQYGYSYAELAQMLLGDVAATKTIDKLLQSALKKVRKADKEYRSKG
ncbi:sigma-70 family RNA polymerase sigma factor [Micromonospora sp. NPDC048930]|uniref:sigma-70 family RNA polymerase sigma factor n=1 Tax=Micromonospora sp. NPDC048930 TaxID=3364261 RepID=UPI0037248385